MRKQNGESEVIFKNKVLLADSLVDLVAATRHGNGRDWWICASSNRTGDFQMFRLGTSGAVEGPFEQKLKHDKWGKLLGFKTQGVFSPDGSLFARFAPLEGLHVYQFDRCSGEFSAPRIALWKTVVTDSGKVSYFDFLGDKIIWPIPSVAFSPNGRFLYGTTGQRCFQFDLAAPDLIGSVQLIGEFVHNPIDLVFQTTIFMPQLAPDGKIYISCTNGTKFLHVIEKPNEKGSDCNFKYRGVPLPVYHGSCLPAHPNYRLHEWAHSPCDSLTYYPPIPVDSCAGQNALVFAPNPANDLVKIQITPCKTGDLRVWNVLGQLLFEQKGLSTDSGKLELIVRDWPTGSYFIEFFQAEKTGRLIRKLIVARKE